MSRVTGRSRLAAAIVIAACVFSGAAAGKTYPDPEAPSIALADWKGQPGVRTLVTELGERELTIPLQAVTAAFLSRPEPQEPETVVGLWVEATLPDLRTVGADTLPRFHEPGGAKLLRIRLHADIPDGVVDMLRAQLAWAVAHGLRRQVASERWGELELWARPDSEQPVVEGIYEVGDRQRFVECRLAKPPGNCSVVYQRADGLTVEYAFGLEYLERIGWLDLQVRTLVAGFVTR